MQRAGDAAAQIAATGGGGDVGGGGDAGAGAGPSNGIQSAIVSIGTQVLPYCGCG